MARHIALGALAAAFSVLSLLPSPASACSANPCSLSLVAGAMVYAPANTATFAVSPPPPGADGPVDVLATVIDVTDAERVVETVVFSGDELTLGVALVERHTYRIELSSICFDAEITSEATIVVGPEAPLPEGLSDLRAGGLQRGAVSVPSGLGSCSDEVGAVYVDIETRLDPAVEPWADLLVWSTWVDRAPYRPDGTIVPPPGLAGSWRGVGVDRVYTRCGELPEATWDEGVDPGPHEVIMRARIPGTDVALETAPVSIGLDCDRVVTGCSVQAGPLPSPAPALLLATGAACVLRRRRRLRR